MKNEHASVIFPKRTPIFKDFAQLNGELKEQGFTPEDLVNGYCAVWALQAKRISPDYKYAITKTGWHVGVEVNGKFCDAQHLTGAKIPHYVAKTADEELAFLLQICSSRWVTGHDSFVFLLKHNPALARKVPTYVWASDPACTLTLQELNRLYKLPIGKVVKAALDDAKRCIESDTLAL